MKYAYFSDFFGLGRFIGPLFTNRYDKNLSPCIFVYA